MYAKNLHVSPDSHDLLKCDTTVICKKEANVLVRNTSSDWLGRIEPNLAKKIVFCIADPTRIRGLCQCSQLLPKGMIGVIGCEGRRHKHFIVRTYEKGIGLYIIMPDTIIYLRTLLKIISWE